MQEQMISDLGIEGLAESTAGMAVLDVMMYIFGFIMAGTIAAVIYSLTLKTLEGLKAATFVLFVIHTLPSAGRCFATFSITIEQPLLVIIGT